MLPSWRVTSCTCPRAGVNPSVRRARISSCAPAAIPDNSGAQRPGRIHMSGAAGHIDPSNKKIALLIAVLALVLAFSETLGKSAQTAALSYNIEASNLWSFFQAKTIRMTQVRTAGERRCARRVRQADRHVEEDRRPLRLRARYPRRPEGACRASQGRRGEARPRAGRLSPLRDRVGGRADRDRACLRGDHHRGDDPCLARRGAGARRGRVLVDWPARADRGTPFLGAAHGRTSRARRGAESYGSGFARPPSQPGALQRAGVRRRRTRAVEFDETPAHLRSPPP